MTSTGLKLRKGYIKYDTAYPVDAWIKEKIEHCEGPLQLYGKLIDCSDPVKITTENGISGFLPKGEHYIVGEYAVYSPFTVEDESLANIKNVYNTYPKWKAEHWDFVTVFNNLKSLSSKKPICCVCGVAGVFDDQMIERYLFNPSIFNYTSVLHPDILNATIYTHDYEGLLTDPETLQLLLYLDKYVLLGLPHNHGIRFNRENYNAVKDLLERNNAEILSCNNYSERVTTLKPIEEISQQIEEYYSRIDALEPPFEFVLVKEEDLVLPDLDADGEDSYDEFNAIDELRRQRNVVK